MPNRIRHRAAFTLVEILIVVLILGILAMLVVPQFSKATEDARIKSALSQLHTIRAQIELYRLQHGGDWPTDDGTTNGFFEWERLTQTTVYGSNPDGSDKVFGPYLQNVPRNPFNNLSTVETSPSAMAGFVLDSDGKFYGVDANGVAFDD